MPNAENFVIKLFVHSDELAIQLPRNGHHCPTGKALPVLYFQFLFPISTDSTVLFSCQLSYVCTILVI